MERGRPGRRNQRRCADAIGVMIQLFELEDEHYEQDRSRR
jgi:hypothetical protein